MSRPHLMLPVTRPVRGTARPPGSKSLTNRAFVVAALAKGDSHLGGVLDSRDTQVMIESLRRLGISVDHNADKATARVGGCGGEIPANSAELWLENSGTSIRFLTALCALGHGRFRLDGNTRMQERPIADLIDALNALGADVRGETNSGCPPLVVEGNGLPGGRAQVAGNISSQYLSALLMAAPGASRSVELQLSGTLVSEPYVDMTIGVMQRFGVDVIRDPLPGGLCYRIEPARYRATDYQIEPDASAASYFMAAAAVTAGEVTIPGLSKTALQGDVEFATALEKMGCGVRWNPDSITITGGELKGVDIDMNAISDTAQTLSVVAMFAQGTTRIRNVEHMRHKETDRVFAVATELRKLGQSVEEHADGLTIHPAPITPCEVATYDDHRMAMSFAIAGLKVPGITIADPECTAKTYPNFFADLEALCR